MELPRRHTIILFDHRPGEIADFIALDRKPEYRITFYHLKASAEDKPGERVEDIYEVSGQLVKSTLWVGKLKRLRDRMVYRHRTGSRFVADRGDREDLVKFFDEAKTERVQFETVIVQPGISKKKLKRLSSLLASMCDYSQRVGCTATRIMCSA